MHASSGSEGGGAIHHSRRGAEDDVAMSRTRLNQRGDDGGVEVEIIQLPVTPGVPSIVHHRIIGGIDNIGVRSSPSCPQISQCPDG